MVEWRFETVYRLYTDTSHHGYHSVGDSHNRNQRHDPCNCMFMRDGRHNRDIVRDFECSLRCGLSVINLRRRSNRPIYLSDHGNTEGA